MLRDVILVREERADAAQLVDTLSTVQRGQFVDGHQLLSELLIIEAVGHFAATGFARVEGVDGFFSQRLR